MKARSQTAHIVSIPNFSLREIDFFQCGEVINYSFTKPNDNWITTFPVIIQCNGIPWQIGNLFLTNRFERDPSMLPEEKTYRGIADDLLAYLRFMEDFDLDYLYLPKNRRKSVIYRYRSYLERLVFKGTIKASTAKQRMNRVIFFYRSIIKWKLIPEKDLSSLPFEEIKLSIFSPNSAGYWMGYSISSSDLALKMPNKTHFNDTIIDGGELRPLSLQEQKTLLKYLLLNGSREMQLIFYFSLFTGARIQTCCTLRIRDLHGKLDSEGHLRLPIGLGTGIDSKGGKRMTLKAPSWLINDLKIYANSDRAKRRRTNSFYQQSENNYVFLTNRGEPYYTSKLEKLDRLSRPDATINTPLKVHDGETIRAFVNKINSHLKEMNPDFFGFRFHDLRATFGMNLLDSLLASLGKDQTAKAALIEVQQRLGHKNLTTTMQYLNYRGRISERVRTQDALEQELLEYIETRSTNSMSCII